jgi:hypothetical protein
MICRRCKASYNAAENRKCPQCGAARPKPKPVFLKTATILISTSEAEGVYRSMEEVPALLRSRLLESTNGQNSATILIADRKGREQIARAARSAPGAREKAGRPMEEAGTRKGISRPMRIAAALIVLVLVALVLWTMYARF